MRSNSVPKTALYIIRELNQIANMGAYQGNITQAGNIVIRFNNPKIPSILVAFSHLNEHFQYKFNITTKQKCIQKELRFSKELKRGGEWYYFYPLNMADKLVEEMLIYKPKLYETRKK